MGTLKDFKCIICKVEFDAENYGLNKCPHCGQEYDYDEAVSIVLTEDQIKLLALDKGID